jgi:hypothetical protein
MSPAPREQTFLPVVRKPARTTHRFFADSGMNNQFIALFVVAHALL